MEETTTTAPETAEVVQAATPSIASIMAKSGVKTTPDSTVAVPEINTESKSEGTAKPTPPVDTANEEKAESTAKTDTPTQTKAPSVEPVKQSEAPKATSLQEVLRNHKPDDILKELGFDEKVVGFLKDAKTLDPKMVNFLEHWKNNGDTKAYLQALSTDFKTMKPEDVMRHQLKAANPELDAKELDALYRIKVINRYKLDPERYSEDEVSEGLIELKADAKPIRDALAKEQESYLLPAAPAKEPQVDVLAELQRKEAESIQEIGRMLEASPEYRDVTTSKKIRFGEGDEAYAQKVDDPKEVLNILYDKDAFARALFYEKDGQIYPNVQKQLFIAQALRDYEGLLKAMHKHSKSIGGKSAIEPIENPKLPGHQTAAPASAYKSAVEAMAKSGRVVRGGE